MDSAKKATYAAVGLLGVGMISPTAAFSSMLSTFALSGVIGYQARHTHPLAAMPPPQLACALILPGGLAQVVWSVL